jgi:Membrane proteins related to metalloendopeptidases
MKKYYKLNVGICMLIVFVFLAGSPFLASMTEKKDAQDNVSAMETEKKKVEETVNRLEKLKGDVEVYIKALDTELDNISSELETLKVSMADKQLEIDNTKLELEAAKQTEEKQYAAMKLRIQYMYEKGDTSYIDLILTAQNATELLSRTEYISKISEYDREQLIAYQATKDAIAAHEVKLQAEYTAMEVLKVDKEAKEAAVQTLINNKTTELVKYKHEIDIAQDQIDKYKADIEKEEKRIAAIEAEIKRKEEEARKAAQAAGQNVNTTGNVGMIWPLPASRRITSDYGMRAVPVAGAGANHNGIDIGAPTGTQIIAAAAGEVVISQYSYSAGNYIMINHGNGVYTVYMHCSQLLVSKGQYVAQGTPIGLVGSTGYSTGPHLHFGVRVNGSYVNPWGYVK